MDSIISIGDHMDENYFTDMVNDLFFEYMDLRRKHGNKNEKTERMEFLEKEIERLRLFSEKEIAVWASKQREEAI